MVRFIKALFAVSIAAGMSAARAETFKAVSPDALNEIRLETGENGMKYSVWRRGKAIVEPTELALKVGSWAVRLRARNDGVSWRRRMGR